ncbi:NERD domain-containing protein [Nocardia sp. NBC_01730]|uniref:nuclease-related domain-containing protein n=1 Tax=Nocardia sp. NBC_01730 TaxID=2975998 RepID=UPI002E138FEB|nr:NERD domain-containing protein [Nocardia sp. NBC_01730]
MLVINERTAAPRSEQRVLDWMRTWTGQYVIVGLAISGCYLPDHNGEGEAREADLVVITPRAAVVVGVKGTAPEAMTGVLSVQANGRWRLSGFEGDPIHVRDHDSSPFDQVSSNVLNLEELVRKHHADAFVDGLIVVVPPRDSNITLNIETRRRGCGVLLGSSPRELRAWFHRTVSRKLIWTAERVHALLGDLDLADQVTLEDLVADGFPLERKLRAGTALAALENAAREPRPVDDTPATGISTAAGTPANSGVPPAHSTVGVSGVAPIAPVASESFAPKPAAPEHAAPEHSASEPLSSGPALDSAAQSVPVLSSPFTDRWSSWIESDADRPVRPAPASSRSHPTPPPQHRLSLRSTSNTGARPLRWPTTPVIVERRPRIADLRRITAALPSTAGRTTAQPQAGGGHRPQQIAAAASIAVIIGAIWLLAVACSTPHGDAVEQRPLPTSPTEVVGPPPTVAETPAQLNLLPLCLPFRSDC